MSVKSVTSAELPGGTVGGRDGRLVARLRALRATAARARHVSAHGLLQRLARRAYDRTGAAALGFQLDPDDVLLDDRVELAVPVRPPRAGSPLTIGWVISPPALGSGGHTTLFRMVEGLEAAGHRCVLFVYDRYGLDVAQRAATIRLGWPGVAAEIVDAAAGLVGVDACVATSWETAHVLARRGTAPMRRLYFIQDYEPYFYPSGSEHELAAMTYRLPFRRIALGHMVATALADEQGMGSDLVPFGCATDTYRFDASTSARSGVVLYAKPGVARRGYELARLALEEFHRRHPEQTVHVYGSGAGDLTFPVERHGRLSPDELNALYSTVVAGLAMSFTNISLVAEEMLAAGVVAVVNDSPRARADMDNPHVRWARPTPIGLAEQLCAAVERPGADDHAAVVAASVLGRSWRETQRQVTRVIEDEVYGRPAW